jgi:tRNA pseudouridine38-40 synthase
VHALAQVASAQVRTALDARIVRRALNAVLPAEVRVLDVEDADPAFHARYSALGKTYEYWVAQGDVQPPFARAWSWHVSQPLDAAAMHLAARALEGTHDFGAFQSSGSDVKTSTRTMRHASVRTVGARLVLPPSAGSFIVCRFEADGFLRHMVRAVVGTLVDVGLRRRDAAAMAAVVASRDRVQAGPTAPAHGLVLVEVRYQGADHGA